MTKRIIFYFKNGALCIRKVALLFFSLLSCRKRLRMRVLKNRLLHFCSEEKSDVIISDNFQHPKQKAKGKTYNKENKSFTGFTNFRNIYSNLS